MIKPKKRKKICCPKCGSNDIGHYLYGLPIMEEIEEQVNTGEIVLGGCVFEVDVSPKYYCHNCGNDFGIYRSSKGK